MDRQIDVQSLVQTKERSLGLIKNLDLKNRKKHFFFPTMIFENFFDEPYLWRQYGLNVAYEYPTSVTYPGCRSKLFDQLDKNIFESFAQRLLSKLPMIMGFEKLWISYHMIDKTYDKGWVHDDDPETNISGIVYLNTDPPPQSGTIIYQDREYTESNEFSKPLTQDCLFFNAEERSKIAEIRDRQRNCFTRSVVAENIYNRCVVFDPRVWHGPDKFFGEDKDTSRLTIVFFGQAVFK